MKHSPRFLKLAEDARHAVTEISVDEVKSKLERKEPFELIDVREDHEFAAGHARGARHMARGVIERDIEATLPDFNTEMVLYCGGGFRSALAAESLQKMGYTKVKSMAGGWREWNDKKGPVTSG
jgi:rhodanese-related sulfurtransferase